MAKANIVLPKNPSSPSVEFPPDPSQMLRSKIEFQTNIIIGIFVVAILTMIFMMGTLLLDSFHYNTAIYKEYSDKIESLEILQEANLELLEQNKQNQEIIIEQQEKILKIKK